ncbi:FecCD family ABC transporter permease [Vallitalea sp.]|jgi:iron complex transport system permease protein|uniref:FecCD family ABC transporter permease n=1 Tax=Vallitalea sp. TaxID=1882829 RepID=UPI0025D10885|nr:iron ABC transporter permease [Vallitalea sp.]MCT4688759.1 iron ABC transporter permease [Vallitalea sp.]
MKNIREASKHNEMKDVININSRAVVKKNGIEAYKSYTAKKVAIAICSIIIMIILSIIAIGAGSTNIGYHEIFRAIIGRGTEVSNVVVLRIRLPRIIAAIVAGAGLSVSGCVMQNNLRNPLASPSTLGISNAAAFGANLAIIIFGAGSFRSLGADAVIINNPYIVTLSAFTLSITAAFVILLLAKLRSFSPQSIILAGVALGSLFSAGTTLIQYFADDVQVAAAVFWTFGDLGRVSWNEVIIMAVVIGIALIYFMLKRWDYNALDSGEESAKSLGVNVERVRFGGMFVSSLITSVAVAFLGIIGFIGLISPQIVRRIIGGDHRFLIPISAITGSIILLFADTLARTIVAPVILPVGAITSFLGAPLFLYLLLRGHNRK